MKAAIKNLVVMRRQLTLERFDANDLTEMVYKAEEKSYDEKGRLLFSAKYQPGGEVEEKRVIEHLDSSVITDYYIDENDISEHTVTQYNEKGQPVHESITYADGMVSESEWEYTGDLPVKKVTVDVDENEISGIQTWEYDAAGNLIRETVFEYGEMVFSREMVYNENNKVISQRTFREGDTGYYTETFQWEGNNMIEMHKTDPHGLGEHHVYQYDEAGNIISAGSGEDLKTQTLIEYNGAGQAIHESETNENQELMYEIHRTYDEQSGLIMKAETYVNRQGYGPDLHYTLEYEYTFWE